jgi:hypothetical protein
MLCKIVLVAGVRLNSCQIAYMEESKSGQCRIYFSGYPIDYNSKSVDATCDAVAAAMNAKK